MHRCVPAIASCIRDRVLGVCTPAACMGRLHGPAGSPCAWARPGARAWQAPAQGALTARHHVAGGAGSAVAAPCRAACSAHCAPLIRAARSHACGPATASPVAMRVWHLLRAQGAAAPKLCRLRPTAPCQPTPPPKHLQVLHSAGHTTPSTKHPDLSASRRPPHRAPRSAPRRRGRTSSVVRQHPVCGLERRVSCTVRAASQRPCPPLSAPSSFVQGCDTGLVVGCVARVSGARPTRAAA